jgi:hypothetical protein
MPFCIQCDREIQDKQHFVLIRRVPASLILADPDAEPSSAPSWGVCIQCAGLVPSMDQLASAEESVLPGEDSAFVLHYDACHKPSRIFVSTRIVKQFFSRVIRAYSETPPHAVTHA